MKILLWCRFNHSISSWQCMKTHLRTYNLLPTLDDCIKSCLSQLTSFALENSDEIESRKILTILYNKMRHNNQLSFNYKCGTYRPGIGNKLCFVHLRNLVNFQLVTRHDWWEVCLNSLTLLIRSKPSSSCLLSIGKRCSWCSTPGYCTIISGVKKNMRCFFYLIVRHSHINYFVQ